MQKTQKNVEEITPIAFLPSGGTPFFIIIDFKILSPMIVIDAFSGERQ